MRRNCFDKRSVNARQARKGVKRPGLTFCMSVGYDLEGIKSPKIDAFIEGLKDASASPVWAVSPPPTLMSTSTPSNPWGSAFISSKLRNFTSKGNVLGVEKETGLTLGYDKYNWEEHPDHFILADCAGQADFGHGARDVYALEGAQVLLQRDREVHLAVNEYGAGRGVYISGLPYSFENSRLLYRAIYG